MENIDRRTDQCQIVASSSLTDDDIEVLKQGDTFGLFDRYGDINSLKQARMASTTKGRVFCPVSS